jgi:hypothetical protein
LVVFQVFADVAHIFVLAHIIRTLGPLILSISDICVILGITLVFFLIVVQVISAFVIHLILTSGFIICSRFIFYAKISNSG